MHITILILIGLSLGSFINLCIYRLPRQISIVVSRSFCPNCNTQLAWYELVPVLSFFFLKRRCSHCGGKIPWSYPAIEILSALIVVSFFFLYGFTAQFIISSFFALVMLTVALIDWQHFIIPNKLLLTGIVIGVGLKFFFARGEIIESFASSALSVITISFFLFFGNRLFKKETMGVGDVKLSGVIGFFLGFQFFLVALWVAALGGMIYGYGRRAIFNSPRDEKIPFGAFLAGASVLVLITEEPLTHLLQWSP